MNLDTDIMLPEGPQIPADIKEILDNKYICVADDRHIIIPYTGFTLEPGMVPCDYSYYLDNDDIEYLLNIVGEKFGITETKKIPELFTFLRFGDGEMDADSKFNFFHDLVDTLSDYAPDLYDKLVAHCEEKAKKEFELAFDYWINNKEKYDYYEDEEI